MYTHINRSLYEYVLEHLPQKKLSTMIMSRQSSTSTSRMKNCMKIAIYIQPTWKPDKKDLAHDFPTPEIAMYLDFSLNIRTMAMNYQTYVDQLIPILCFTFHTCFFNQLGIITHYVQCRFPNRHLTKCVFHSCVAFKLSIEFVRLPSCSHLRSLRKCSSNMSPTTRLAGSSASSSTLPI